MKTATITFADDSHLTLHEGELMFGITFTKIEPSPHASREQELADLKSPYSASQVDAIELWSHSDVGLFISVADLTHNYEYFGEQDNSDVFYKSSSVVKIVVN